MDVQNLVRYLCSITKFGLELPKNFGDVQLKTLCDTNWIRANGNDRSRLGYVVFSNGTPTIWYSKLQIVTALSTAEAEFDALASRVPEVRWIRATIFEIFYSRRAPTTIYLDNLGGISSINQVQYLWKAKHVFNKYHYVRESVASKEVEVKYEYAYRAVEFTKGHIEEPFENYWE